MNHLDQTFSALSDPTRRAILGRLALGDTTVGELAKPFAISAPAISRHLRVLEDASLIVTAREGKHRRCRLNSQALASVASWLEQYRRFWDEGFDRLDQLLTQEDSSSDPDC
jgi:DNA-binding transcriptional ArsR family regulator